MPITLTAAVAQAATTRALDSSLAGAIRQLADSVGRASRAAHDGGVGLADAGAALGAVIALVTLVTGIVQYTRAQRVERAKFAMQAVREFEADAHVRNAQRMLDWDGRHVTLWPDGDPESPTTVAVGHATLARALRTSDLEFTDDEIAIRDTFDRFFDQLGRFERQIEDGLLADYNVKPALAYWCNLLAGTGDHRRPYAPAVAAYLTAYGFDEARRLVNRFAARRGRRDGA